MGSKVVGLWTLAQQYPVLGTQYSVTFPQQYLRTKRFLLAALLTPWFFLTQNGFRELDSGEGHRQLW